jgi:hypothetical protein
MRGDLEDLLRARRAGCGKADGGEFRTFSRPLAAGRLSPPKAGAPRPRPQRPAGSRRRTGHGRNLPYFLAAG